MLSPIRSMAVGALLASLTAPTAWAQAKAAAEEQVGMKVGEKAPKFTLRDQEGRERSLDELLKKGKVALVFYRSADW